MQRRGRQPGGKGPDDRAGHGHRQRGEAERDVVGAARVRQDEREGDEAGAGDQQRGRGPRLRPRGGPDAYPILGIRHARGIGKTRCFL